MVIFLVKRIFLYYQLVFISLTRGIREKTVPVSLRRIIVMLLMNIAGAVVFIINWICICADEIFFPRYRYLAIKKPVFILGVFRSGSTLLLRQMALDTHNFTSFKLWEALFAPSIVQRKIFGLLGKVDQKTCGFLSRPIKKIDRRLFGSSKPIHQVGLFLPEEDAVILIWILSTFFLFFGYPFFDQFEKYVKFDRLMPEKEKKQILCFYHKMVQRHLYHHGPEKIFLSKNPTFSSLAGTLKQWFPDAVFLNTIRHPYQQIPSFISLLVYFTEKFGCDFLKTADYRDRMLDIVTNLYLNPVARLKKIGQNQYAIIRFESLTGNPGETVTEIYDKIHVKPPADIESRLREKSAAAGKYKSTHSYSLEKFGLTTREIQEKCRAVFNEFGFIP